MYVVIMPVKTANMQWAHVANPQPASLVHGSSLALCASLLINDL